MSFSSYKFTWRMFDQTIAKRKVKKKNYNAFKSILFYKKFNWRKFENSTTPRVRTRRGNIKIFKLTLEVS